MKKIALMCVIIVLLPSLALCSCRARDTAVFEFEISPESITVDTDEDGHISITVLTRCVSGEYVWRGSSTVLGGEPTIYDADGNRLAKAQKVQSDDSVYNELSAGDAITQTWRFYKTMYGIDYYWEPGVYSVKVEFAGRTAVFEGAVVIE